MFLDLGGPSLYFIEIWSNYKRCRRKHDKSKCHGLSFAVIIIYIICKVLRKKKTCLSFTYLYLSVNNDLLVPTTSIVGKTRFLIWRAVVCWFPFSQQGSKRVHPTFCSNLGVDQFRNKLSSHKLAHNLCKLTHNVWI